MNLLDVVVIVLMLSGVAAGYAMGLIARAVSWLGLAVGLAVAVALLPTVGDAASGASALALLVISLLVLGLGAFTGSALGEALGRRLRKVIPPGPARTADRVGGAVVGAAGVLVGLWLIAPVMAEIPGYVARQARTSALAEFVTDVGPAAPEATETLRRLVDKANFPQVFADLRAAPDAGDAPTAVSVPADVLAQVIASTVKVESRGCDRIQEGSGFAVGPELVMTNAHVVAGGQRVAVRRPDGARLDARVVKFDDNRDLAVLRVPGLAQDPLIVADARAGVQGAVVGHPGGQRRPRSAPAIVRRQVSTVGRDIYGDDRVRRDVLFLAADLASGDSGGPMVDTGGRVVGVAFAVAPDRSSTAFALPDEEINAVLRDPATGGPGPCIT